MGFISRLTTAGLLAVAVGGGYHLLNNRNSAEKLTALTSASRRPASSEYEYFSPADNLEHIEISELRTAGQRLRGSRAALNIAMYSFTDRTIAQVLAVEADAGTIIRVYRDGEQYEAEERDAVRYGRGPVTAMFRRHSNIHVRVKPASRVELMHLKCWSDGQVLRDGSANWSTAGLKRQDNVRFTTDTKEVQEFNRNFEQLWNRPENIRVQ